MEYKMSRNLAPQLAIKVAQETARERLKMQNKEQARAHLLQIQLLLARRVVPASK
jgi:hypothetical protein